MKRSPIIKCVVWDLDNTLWDGVLLEGDDVRVRLGAIETISELDRRGVVHSIASRSDSDTALAKLRDLGLEEMFLAPQISWGPKSAAIRSIASELNISTDAIAFVDDDPFERDQVSSELPDVLVVDAVDIPILVEKPEFEQVRVTRDASQRRHMYQAELGRRKDEQAMTPGEFLASLDMTLSISPAREDDLDRLEELTVRTNQLNSTGYTYSHEDLAGFSGSPRHRLLVAGLEDRYGTYGKVGVALIDLRGGRRLLRLFLMSCRVMSRGIGRILLTHVLLEARAAGSPLQAEFIRTDRNRPMYLTFKMAGFREIDRNGDIALLEHDLTAIDPYPDHVRVNVEV